MDTVGWNSYDVFMKLRPAEEIDETGNKIKRPSNNPFIKG